MPLGVADAWRARGTVNSVPLQVLLYAVVAGASPIALGSVLVVLHGDDGRWKGVGFATGVVLGQLALCGLAYAVGSAAAPKSGHAHENLRAFLELLLGVAMLTAAGYLRSRPPTSSEPRTSHRTAAIFDRLARLGFWSVLFAGVALSLGPKRIGLTLLIMATVSSGDLPGPVSVALVLLYVAVATVLVTVPVASSIVLGERGELLMRRAEAWIATHRRPLTFFPLAILGAIVTFDALVALFR